MENKKHIALLLANVGGGGAERMMLNLAIGFSNENFTVDLVLFKAQGAYLKNIPENINIVDLDVKRALFSFFKVKKYLQKHKPAAMISTLSRVNISAVIGKKLSGVDTQIILREANTFSVYMQMQKNLWDRLIFYCAKYIYPFADNVVGVSIGVADDIKANFKRVDNNKISVIYNPVVNNEIFEKAEQTITHPWFKENIPIILGVGRITPQKDFCTLIKAFDIVKKRIDARLLILGSGKKEEGGTPEEFDKVKKMILQLNLKEYIDLPGFTDNPFKYMKNSALFVLSSKWEGLPGVLIQALACGCPSVSTDCPSGPSEILNKGEFGELVPIGDFELLAEAILKTINNPSEKETLVNRAKEFSIKRAVDKYSKLIN